MSSSPEVTRVLMEFSGGMLVHEAHLRLVHARIKRAARRGLGTEHVLLDNVVVAAREHPADLLAVEALNRLEAMGVDETAEAMGIPNATVKRDWTVARASLNQALPALV